MWSCIFILGAQENRKHKIFKFDNSEINKDIFRDNEYLFTLLQNEISAGRLRAINISGGEPLITDAHWKLLNFLIDNDLTNISLVTQLTFKHSL